MLSIGADIGGSHISSCLFKHSDKVLMTESMVIREVNRLGSKEEILSDWVNALSLTSKASKSSVRGVGLAMPGPFDYHRGISLIKGVDKFESLYLANVREELAQRLNLEGNKVRFINDATAFTIAECLIGEAKYFNRCVGITLGTGFGSAFTDKSRPLIGGKGVPAGGVLYDKKYNGLLADDIFSTRGLIKRYFDKAGIMCDSVLQLASNVDKDPWAEQTFLQFGAELGLFLRPYLESFEAEGIVLGGNICQAFHLFKHTLQSQLKEFKIYVSTYGQKAAMIGAARLLDDDYYSQIEEALKEM